MDPHTGAIAHREFEQAERELERGHILAALGCLERALAIWDDPLWHSRLGYCIAKERGQHCKGVALCLASLAAEPDRPDHFLNLGRVHLVSGDKKEALRVLREGMAKGGSPELARLLDRFGTRNRPVIPILSRRNPLNKYLGLLLSRLGRSQ